MLEMVKEKTGPLQSNKQRGGSRSAVMGPSRFVAGADRRDLVCTERGCAVQAAPHHGYRYFYPLHQHYGESAITHTIYPDLPATYPQQRSRFLPGGFSPTKTALSPEASEVACGHLEAHCGLSFDTCMQQTAISRLDVPVGGEVGPCLETVYTLSAARMDTESLCRGVTSCLPHGSRKENSGAEAPRI